MDGAREFRFVAQKVYTIPGKGVVVIGRVEKGTVSVGDEIGFLGPEGQMVRATVLAIEVSRRLVEQAQAGKEASLLLEGARKNQITQGTILMEAPEAAPGPVIPAPSPQEAAPYGSGEPSSLPGTGRPIEPSSGWGRFLVFLLLGLVVLLLLLLSRGNLDREKLDPRKWDPRKRLTRVEPAGESFRLSAVSFRPPSFRARHDGGGFEPACGVRRAGSGNPP